MERSKESGGAKEPAHVREATRAGEPEAVGEMSRKQSRRGRLMKRGLIVVAVAAVAVLALFFAARAMFPAEKLRELAVTKLEQTTGLEITVRDARISFVHWRLGVKVSDIEVSKPGEDTKLASIPQAGAALALLPLLRREIVVSEVYVERPRIEIVAGKPAPIGASAGSMRSPGATPALSFQLPKAVIRDAEIVYRDLKGGQEIRVENLDVSSRAKAARGFETVTSDGKFSAEKVSLISLVKGKPSFPAQSVKGTWKVLARPKEELLELQSVSISVAELPIEVTGRINLAKLPASAGLQTSGAGQKAPGPELNLNIVMKDVALEKLVSLAPGDVASKVENVSKGGTLNVECLVKGRLPAPSVATKFSLAAGGATKLDGRVELSTQEPRELVFETNGTLKLEELQSLFAAGEGAKATTGDVTLNVWGTAFLDDLKKDPYSVEALGQVLARNVRIETRQAVSMVVVEKLNVRLARRRADVSQTVVKLGSSTFNISGTVPDWRKRSFQFKVDSPLLNLKELLLPAAPAAKKTEKKTTAVPPLPFAALGMQGTTAVRVDKLTFGSFEARDVNATVLVGGDSVYVTEVTMRALGGTAGGKALLRVPRDGEPNYSASFSAGDVQLGAVLDAFTPLKGLMNGATSFEIALNGVLGEEPVPTMSIAALGGVKSSQVNAIATPLVTALATWVGLESKTEYAIKDFATSFSVRDGRLIVPACSLVEKNSMWKFSGSTGLDGSLDQKVNVVLSPEYSKRVSSLKDLGQLLKDEQGRVVVDLFLGGTVKKPALRWNSARMEQRAKEYLAGKLKGELEKQVKKRLDVTPETRTQMEQKADSLKKEVTTAGKKLLEGLMKKKK